MIEFAGSKLMRELVAIFANERKLHDRYDVATFATDLGFSLRQESRRGRATAMLVDWLEELMRSRDISQTELGEAVGLSRDKINKVMKRRRRLASDELLKIARFFDVKPPDAEGGSGDENTTNARSLTYVSVVGEVAAGRWAIVSDSDFVSYDIPYAVEDRWPPGAVEALVVRGESINRLARDGDIAIMLKLDHAPRYYQSGDLVIVERQRFDLVETTVKRIRGSERTGWELWPESDSPTHQDAIPLATGGDISSVRVVGFVLDFIRPVTRFEK